MNLIRLKTFRFSLLIIALVQPRALTAEVKPAGIFADRMVLQSGLPVAVWGTASKGATVHLDFHDQSHTSTADPEGRWTITLKPLKPSSTPRVLVVRSGGERVVRKDVLVGEVWFAAGQSNMGYTAGGMAKHLAEGKRFVDSADLPEIRFCKISESDSPRPLSDLPELADWDVCTPQSVINHSAVAFVFARRLQKELGVPVGVIDCSWGGKPIEPFIPIEAFDAHPTLIELAIRAKAGDIAGIQAMAGGTYVRSSSWLPGTIYNGRIAPIIPYGIRGVIWYQGESNCGSGEDPRDYQHKMRALLRGWRHVWAREDLPIYYVQLPQWTNYAWTYLREEQRRVLTAAHTGMVVTIDLDNGNDIHPPNKIDVGERLARWPLANEYSRDIAVSGPMFREAKVHETTMAVTFDQLGTGLMVGRNTGVQAIQEDLIHSLNGFELTGRDDKWYPAQARIEGDQVIVSSHQVTQPVAVRYACHPEARPDQPWNLYSKDGLPASPFCSDWSRMPYDPGKNPLGNH